MKQQNNNIEQLFKEKLQNFEAAPSANAWANVKTGISSGTAVGSAGSATWTSTAIVGVIITTIAIGGFFLFNNEGEKKISIQTQTTEEESTTNSTTPIEDFNSNLENIEEEAISEANSNNVVNDQSPEQTSDVEIQEFAKNNSNKSIEEKIEATIETKNSEHVYEKTIDEIITEHQQFIDEQEVDNNESANLSNSSATDTDTEIDQETKSASGTKESSSNLIVDDVTQQRIENKLIADQVIFPNTFTPDSDGYNDIFKLITQKSTSIDNIQVDIIGLNGKIVGAYQGIYEGWDGRLPNGSAAPEGSYKYQAIIYIGEKQIPKVGGFRLER